MYSISKQNEDYACKYENVGPWAHIVDSCRIIPFYKSEGGGRFYIQFVLFTHVLQMFEEKKKQKTKNYFQLHNVSIFATNTEK